MEPHLCPVLPQHFLVHVQGPQVAGSLCGVWGQFPAVSLLVVSQFVDGTPHSAPHRLDIDQLVCCSRERHDGIARVHPAWAVEEKKLQTAKADIPFSSFSD